MIRIDARRIVTDPMIQNSPIIRNVTKGKVIRNSISSDTAFFCVNPEARSTVRVVVSRPFPATRSFYHVFPETFHFRSRQNVLHWLRISSDQAEPCDGNRLQARATWAAVETERGDLVLKLGCDSPLSSESNDERLAEMTSPLQASAASLTVCCKSNIRLRGVEKPGRPGGESFQSVSRRYDVRQSGERNRY